MEVFKYILILLVMPFVLIFCYFVGSFSIYALFRNSDSVNNINSNSWTSRVVFTILGMIIVVVISKIMEQAGCSPNDDYYRM